MHKLAAAGLIIATLAVTVTAVFACGDKLVLFSGVGRFRQVNAGAHPASILAYTRQNSTLPDVLQDLERQPTLKKAGHKFYSVGDPAQLDQALKTGHYDLLL